MKRLNESIISFAMGSRSNVRSRVVLAIYVACFEVGAFNHARDFLVYGWRPYSWGPPLLETFWTSLVLLDLLAIALILSRLRRWGLLLAAAIMISDVMANTYALVVLAIPEFGLAVSLQSTFLGFVLGSLPFVWPGSVPAWSEQQ